jgi:hypothetical protein
MIVRTPKSCGFDIQVCGFRLELREDAPMLVGGQTLCKELRIIKPQFMV